MDNEYRELLKKLRGRLAYKKCVEPYRVFRDVELELLIKHKPRTIDSLCQIKGFPAGGKRVLGYGECIIAVFNRPNDIEDFDVEIDENDSDMFKVDIKLKPLNLF